MSLSGSRSEKKRDVEPWEHDLSVLFHARPQRTSAFIQIPDIPSRQDDERSTWRSKESKGTMDGTMDGLLGTGRNHHPRNDRLVWLGHGKLEFSLEIIRSEMPRRLQDVIVICAVPIEIEERCGLRQLGCRP